MLDICVLGPLSVSVDGQSALPTAAKPRQMLALLALRTGEFVPVSTLMEEIWGDNPPRSAVTTIQTYVLQLRRLISPSATSRPAKEVIATRFNGYTLSRVGTTVDAHVYVGIAGRANSAYQSGDFSSASRLSREALRLWSGPALIDVNKGLPLDIEVACLEQSRLGLLVTGLESELILGKHQAMLAELSLLVARNPMHENLSSIFMVALYRSGQQARSLEIYSELRSSLADRLGVEPSARLRMLHLSILSSDPALEYAAM